MEALLREEDSANDLCDILIYEVCYDVKIPTIQLNN